MPRFPEVDGQPLGGYVDVLREPAVFEAVHSQAENANRLYNIGHAGIKSMLSTLVLDPRVAAAIESGVRAYEAVNGLVLPSDVHGQYTSEHVIEVITDRSRGSNLGLDFLIAFDEQRRAMATSAPLLTDAIGELVDSQLEDPSSELRQRGLEGAAIMRSLQLELDELLAFEADLKV
jgi:hypothetical protein